MKLIDLTTDYTDDTDEDRTLYQNLLPRTLLRLQVSLPERKPFHLFLSVPISEIRGHLLKAFTSNAAPVL